MEAEHITGVCRRHGGGAEYYIYNATYWPEAGSADWAASIRNEDGEFVTNISGQVALPLNADAERTVRLAIEYQIAKLDEPAA